MTTFKKGDKVRAMNKALRYSHVREGEIVTVKGIDVDGDVIVEANYGIQYLKPEDVELVSESTADKNETVSKFEVGDFAKGNELAGLTYRFTGEGAIVQVIEINEDKGRSSLRVEYVHPNGRRSKHWVLPQAFDKVSKEDGEALRHAMAEYPQIGDRVKVVNFDYISYADEYMTEKDSYEVIDEIGDGGIVVRDDEGDRFSILATELKGVEVVEKDGKAVEPKPKSSETKRFKKGDRIRTKPKYEGAKDYTWDGIKDVPFGSEGTFDHYDEDGDIQAYFDEFTEGTFTFTLDPAEVEPASEAVEPKLGDKVRLKFREGASEFRFWGSEYVPEGTEGVIDVIHVDDDVYGIRLTDIEGDSVVFNVIREEFDIIETGSAEFKVGDKVRMKYAPGERDWIHGGSIAQGTVGTITHIDGDRVKVTMPEFCGGRIGFSARVSEMEPLGESEVPMNAVTLAHELSKLSYKEITEVVADALSRKK